MALSAGTPASACNTPVYRYAMYNWASTPYAVFYFHEGTPAEEDEAVNKLLVELSEAEPPANVYFNEVDVSEEEWFSRLHPLIKKLYEANAEVPKPMHLIITPWGAELFAGRLDEAKVKAMVASPARTKMNELLAEGNITVLMILTGPNADENQRAEKVAGEVVDVIVSGEIPVGIDPVGYGPEMPYDDNEQGDDEDGEEEDDGNGNGDEDSKGRAKIAVLKVSRTDAAEEWLVRMLLSIEPDLDEFPDDAMIFATYGRGRAMPPYIGKGITADNLIDCVMFLAGACSCMVKDQNPGMDLLMQCDWNATADALAADDPAFDDDPWGYQEFEPQPPEDGVESTADAPAGDAPAENSPPGDSPPGGVETTSQSVANAAAAEADQTPDVNSAEGAISPAVAEAADNTAATLEQIAESVEFDNEPASFAMRQAWTIGLGLAIATFLVVVAGLVLVRRPPQ